jgi:hypothetical protein
MPFETLISSKSETTSASPDATNVELRTQLEQKIAAGGTLSAVEKTLAKALGIALDVTAQSIDRHFVGPAKIAAEGVRGVDQAVQSALGTGIDAALQVAESIPPSMNPVLGIVGPIGMGGSGSGGARRLSRRIGDMLSEVFPTTGGTKRLDFPDKPGKGKSWYFDLEGSKKAIIPDATDEAIDLSADVASQGAAFGATPGQALLDDVFDITADSPEAKIAKSKSLFDSSTSEALEDFLRIIKNVSRETSEEQQKILDGLKNGAEEALKKQKGSGSTAAKVPQATDDALGASTTDEAADVLQGYDEANSSLDADLEKAFDLIGESFDEIQTMKLKGQQAIEVYGRKMKDLPEDVLRQLIKDSEEELKFLKENPEVHEGLQADMDSMEEQLNGFKEALRLSISAASDAMVDLLHSDQVVAAFKSAGKADDTVTSAALDAMRNGSDEAKQLYQMLQDGTPLTPTDTSFLKDWVEWGKVKVSGGTLPKPTTAPKFIDGAKIGNLEREINELRAELLKSKDNKELAEALRKEIHEVEIKLRRLVLRRPTSGAGGKVDESLESIKKVGKSEEALEVHFSDGSSFDLDEVLASGTPKAIRELIKKMQQNLEGTSESMKIKGGQVIKTLSKKLDDLNRSLDPNDIINEGFETPNTVEWGRSLEGVSLPKLKAAFKIIKTEVSPDDSDSQRVYLKLVNAIRNAGGEVSESFGDLHNSGLLGGDTMQELRGILGNRFVGVTKLSPRDAKKVLDFHGFIDAAGNITLAATDRKVYDMLFSNNNVTVRDLFEFLGY